MGEAEQFAVGRVGVLIAAAIVEVGASVAAGALLSGDAEVSAGDGKRDASGLADGVVEIEATVDSEALARGEVIGRSDAGLAGSGVGIELPAGIADVVADTITRVLPGSTIVADRADAEI